MRKDEEETGAKPNLRDLSSESPSVCRSNSGCQRKKEAVRQPPMKAAAISVKEETCDDVHVRQVRKDDEVKRCPPTCEGVPAQQIIGGKA